MSNVENRFKTSMESLFNGMDTFLTTKTVVGEAIHIGDTIILPLVNVTFGAAAGTFAKNQDGSNAGGGMGGKMTPAAVLVITNGTTRMISLSNNSGIDKVLDMVPDFVDKFKNKGKESAKNQAKKAMEETIIEASRIEEDNEE